MIGSTKDASIVLAPHWRAFGVWYLAMLMIGLGPFNNPQAVLSPAQGLFVAALIGAGCLMKYRTSRLIVTAEEIVRKGGLWDRRTMTMPTAELGQVRVMSGITQRLLGVGVIHLVPRDEGRIITFWGVAEPREAAGRIRSLAGLSA